MNFQEALNEVISSGKPVMRKSIPYDLDQNTGLRPWSLWVQISLDLSLVNSKLLLFESREWDETKQDWVGEYWNKDQLSVDDVMADDWEIVEE